MFPSMHLPLLPLPPYHHQIYLPSCTSPRRTPHFLLILPHPSPCILCLALILKQRSYNRYDGSEEGGQLTEAVRRRPFSVVLLDKVEKAHVAVLNTLIEVLDHGRLSDGHDRIVDFTNTVITMTSNLGTEHFHDTFSNKSSMESVRERVMQKVNFVILPHSGNSVAGEIKFQAQVAEQIR